MGDKTGISWSNATWNPVTGCDKVSPGCGLPRFEGDDTGGCYAMAMAARLKAMGQAKYQNDGQPPLSGPGFGVTTHPSVLTQPLRWTRPRRIFVTSMGDLLHKDVPTEFIAQVFAVMAGCPRHIFQQLTKRHGRLCSLLNDDQFWYRVAVHASRIGYQPGAPVTVLLPEHDGRYSLPNVHVGVSAEDQHWAGIRLDTLGVTPAAVRWASLEPLLGPINLSPWLSWLDWVVVGGESGPGHRPMDIAWLESIVAQCQDAGVAVHVKQASGPRSGMQGNIPGDLWALKQFPGDMP